MDLPSRSGTYILSLHVGSPQTVDVGALGRCRLVRGYYLYAGSAHGPGGLQARVARHLREEKQKHWHIDYIQPQQRTAAIWVLTSERVLEHRVAGILLALPGATAPFPGFGSSDCDCRSHLINLPKDPVSAQVQSVLEPLANRGERWQRIPLGER